MLNEKAKQELSNKDQTFLSELVGRGIKLMTPAEKAHVVARQGYLSKETLKELNIKVLEEEVDNSGDDSQVSPYDSMDFKEVKALCKDRGIEGVTKKVEMVEALIADDKGELEEEEVEVENK